MGDGRACYGHLLHEVQKASPSSIRAYGLRITLNMLGVWPAPEAQHRCQGERVGSAEIPRCSAQVLWKQSGSWGVPGGGGSSFPRL